MPGAPCSRLDDNAFHLTSERRARQATRQVQATQPPRCLSPAATHCPGLRRRRGVSPNTAGKDHTSHRLVNLGYSQHEAVLLLYLITGAFGMIGLFVTQATVVEGYLMAGMTAVIGLLAIYRLEKVK